MSTDSFRRALRDGVSGIVKFLFGQKVNFSLINYSKGKIVFPRNKLLIKYEFRFVLLHEVRYEMEWLEYCVVLVIGFHSKVTK